MEALLAINHKNTGAGQHWYLYLRTYRQLYSFSALIPVHRHKLSRWSNHDLRQNGRRSVRFPETALVSHIF